MTYEEQQLQLETEVLNLIATFSFEELDKRFFKDFGCINFRSEEYFHELGLARIYHAKRMAAEPDAHKLEHYDRYHCYHVTECSCGFSEACDSSD